jgi:hypothetical protein
MANKPITLPLAQEQPGPSLNLRFQLVFASTGAPVRCPAFTVAPGMVVTLRTINGAQLNTAVCFVADYPEALGTVASVAIPPGADVTLGWPIDNTGDIWAQGTEGDGLLVSIQQSAIG